MYILLSRESLNPCCVQVSVIDKGLLEELVLSANRITEIPAENLASTLKARLLNHQDSSNPFLSVSPSLQLSRLHWKVLELRSNRLCSLDGLVGRPLPCLQYLGLACNPLGSCQDIAPFTGTHWSVTQDWIA